MIHLVLYPVTRLPIILNQLLNEENMDIINCTIYDFLFEVSRMYLPLTSVDHFNNGIANFFFRKAAKEKYDKAI